MTNTSANHSKPPFKRKKKLINPALQLRLIGTFFGVAGICLLLQALLLGLYLTEAARAMPAGGPDLLTRIPALIRNSLFVSFGVFVPLVLAIGIHRTFRMVGPIYRFEQHLKGIARGEDMGLCRIRKRDDLQELCRLINAAVQRLQADAREPSAGTTADEDAA